MTMALAQLPSAGARVRKRSVGLRPLHGFREPVRGRFFNDLA